MADEREELLDQETAALEEQTKELAVRMQELLGIDCASGACVFDPAIQDVETKIADVKKRKATLEEIREALNSCDPAINPL
jgi:chaperonin cofactor prefoldin